MSALPKTEESERVNFVFQNLNSSEKIIVRISKTDTLEDADPDLLIHYAEILADSLATLQKEGLLEEVFYKTDPAQILDVMGFLYENLPYFIEESDYERIDTLLSTEKIRETLAENKRLLTSPMGMVYREALLKDPLHLSNTMLKQLSQFQLENQYQAYDGYLFSHDLKALFLFATPFYPSSETARNKIMVERLDNLTDCVVHLPGAEHEGETVVDVTYFGAAAVAVANATRIKKDSTASILIAVILMSLILVSYFRNVRSLVLLLLPIAFGGLLSLAALYLIKGTISAIAIGTGSIVLGIAIDYSLHFLIHLRQEPSVEKTLKEISFPLIVGSTTTIAAFITLIFLKSELLEDFGLFAAFTLIGTILFTLIFLPHFVSKKKLVRQNHNNTTIWNKIADYSFENNKVIILLIMVLTVIFLFFAGDVQFESELNKINYMTQRQRKALEELSRQTTLSQKMTYFAQEGNTLEEALAEYEKNKADVDILQQKGVINHYTGIGNFLPSREMQRSKIERWNSFWDNKREETIARIKEEGEKMGFAENSFENFFALLYRSYQPQPVAYFSPLRKTLLDNFLIDKNGKGVVLTMLYSDPEKASEIAQALPSDDHNFTFDTSTLAQSLISELSNEFNYLLWICGIVVVAFLFFSFGRIEITLIAFSPMCIAFVWILGIMGIADIRFNIINIILATFIFGIGDDYSIFIMEGLLYEYTYGKKMLGTYKTAVILSAVTMFVGIGSLIVAQHPAMFSLAQVTIIGMISVAIITYTVSPFLFKWMTRKNGKIRPMPVTLWNLVKTLFSFIVFLTGTILLSLTGFFLITLGGKSEKQKYRFHLCLYATMRILCKMMIQIPFRILNPHGETFEKPGIVISNHQSHLDLLYTLALTPKLVVLTNKWVWNSPFYGWILRYADFIPVADGIENHMDKLEKIVESGYSILIFPEGTRSADCSILRFHKGAFYLAEKLKLDIIPVVLHGIGHLFPKSEFMLRKGRVTVKILNRIEPGNIRYRQFDDIASTAKEIRRLYVHEYRQLVSEIETPAYFQDLVRHNYTYKGSMLERQIRQLLKKNNHFTELISSLPDHGEIEIENCGTGAFTLTAALTKKELHIFATDDNPENIEIAAHCGSCPPNLHYSVKSEFVPLSTDRYRLSVTKQNELILEKLHL